MPRTQDLASGWYYDPESPGWGLLITKIGETRYNIMLFYTDYNSAPTWVIGELDIEEGARCTLMRLGGYPQLPGMVAPPAGPWTAGELTLITVDSNTQISVNISLRGPAVVPPTMPNFSPKPPTTHEWSGTLLFLV